MFPMPATGQMPNITGGHASARTGDQVTGQTMFGAFNYNSAPPYMLMIVAGLAAVWLLSRR